MTSIVLVNKATLEKANVDTNQIVLKQPTIIHTKLHREDVAEFIQQGNTLILKLKNGETIVIENYFDAAKDGVTSDLVFEDNDCGFLWFDWNGGVPLFKELSGLEALLPIVGGSTSTGFLPWLVGGAVVGGGIYAGTKDKDKGSSKVPGEITVDLDPTGTITGTTKNVPANSEVTLVIKGKDKDGNDITETIKVTTDKDGNYTANVPEDFVDGTTTVDASTTDQNGDPVKDRDEEPLYREATVTVEGYEDNVGNDPENIASGEATNDNKPVLSGSATNAKTVDVYVDGQFVGTADVDSNGKWKLPELTEALADGDHTITAIVKDLLGREVNSNEYTVTVDTYVDAGQPEIVTDFDGSSTITTTVDPKDVVKVEVIDPKTGKPIEGLGVTGPDAEGKVVITGKIPEGVTPELKVTDKVGNEEQVPVTDKTPVATVTVEGYEDNVGNDPENIASGQATNDNKPVLSGSATNAKTVDVYVDGQFVGTTTVDANGKWELPELTEALADGDHIITAEAKDALGRKVTSNEYTVTVDTQVDAGQPEIVTDFDGSSTITTTVDPKDVVKVEVIDPKTGKPIEGLTVKGPDAEGKVVITGKIPEGVTPELKVTDKVGNDKQVPVTDKTPVATVTVEGYEDNVGNDPENIASGGETNDNKPVLSGSATNAKTVDVYVDGQFVGTADVDSNGKWKLPELTEALADGDHTITAKAKDALGREVTSNEYTVTVDTQVDAGQPEIVTDFDGSSTITTTVDPKDVVKVEVIDPKTGKPIEGLTVKGPDAEGKVVITGKIPEGVTPELKVTDKVGNEEQVPVTDKTPVATVTVEGYEDNVGNDPENIASGQATNDNKPVLSGSATNAKTVDVYVDGQFVGTTTVDANGKWELPELTEALADGDHIITAKAKDALGREVTSNEYTVTVDTQVDAGQPEIVTDFDGSSTITTTVDPKDVVKVEVIDPKTGKPIEGLTVKGPDAEGKVVITGKIPEGVTPELKVTDKVGNDKQVPVTDKTPVATVTVEGYEDNVGNDPENIASGQATNDNKPVLSGSATNAKTVDVYVDGQFVGTADVDSNGKWELPELTEALADGDHTITAKAKDALGREVTSNEYTVTVDTQVDAGQPEIVTDFDGSSTITTTVDPKDVVKVEVIDPKTGKPIEGLVVTGPDAEGKVVITGKIPEGVTPELKVTDKVGNEEQVPVTDKTPVATVTVEGYEDNVGNDPENIASGGETNDNKPVLSGSATNAKTVDVYVDGQFVGTADVDSNGKWKLPELTEALADGDHTITAKAKDALGREVTSNEYTVTVDTQVDAGQPEIVTDFDGSSTITTTVDPKDVVKVEVIDPKTGKPIEGLTVKGPDAEGKVVITGKIPEGVTPELKVTDKVGNEEQVPVTDKTPVATVTVEGYEDNVGNDPENIASGQATNDNKPVLSGSATNAKTVDVYVDGQFVGTTTVDANGKWELPELTEALADGDHIITAKAKDALGREVTSNEYTVTVDTQVDAGQPEIVTDFDGSSTITTTVDPKDVVKVEVIDPKTGKPIEGLTVKGPDAEGKVVITGKIPEGVTPELKVTDKVGNDKQVPVTDKTPVATVTVEGYEDNVGNDPENIASGQATNDNKPVLSGSATNAKTVDVYVDGQFVGTADVDSNGKWELPELTEALADGDHTITAKAKDALGREVTSNEYTVTVDTQVDAGQPEIVTDFDGSSTITTTVDPKDVVKVEVIDPKTGKPIEGLVVTGPDAEGKVVITGKIPEGVTPELKVTDKVGNEEQVPVTDKTPVATVTVEGYEDNVGNDPENIASGGETNDNKPVLSGSATNAKTVDVYVDGQFVGTADVDSNGKWELPELTEALADGDHTITAKAKDALGREVTSNEYTVTVDTQVDAGQPEIVTDFDGSSTITTTVDPKDVVKVEVIDPKTGKPIEGLVVTGPDAEGKVVITGKIPEGVTPELKVTDKVGNDKQVPVTDKTPVATVTVEGYEDNVGNDPENIASGGETNDNKPVLSGSATNAKTVDVYVDGQFVGTADVDSNGKWKLPELTEALSEGDHTITAKAKDALGREVNSNEYTVTVKAALTANDDFAEVDEDEELKGNVAENDTTSSRGPLTYEKTTDPENGSVEFNADGTYTYKPNPNFNGKDSFTYTVFDAESGESATKTVTITVKPVVDLTAEDDFAEVDEDGKLNGNVAENDKTISGGELRYEKTTDPANGTLVFNADGTYTYEPNPNFNGTDTFTYTVYDDASGEQSTQTVTITVNPVNDDPTAVDDEAIGDEGKELKSEISVLENDFDIDWDYQAEGEKDKLSVDISKQPIDGFVTEHGGRIIFEADGNYVYKPAPGFNGHDTVKYTITDGHGGTATATLKIKVNPKPITEDDQLDVKLLEAKGNILDNDSDRDQNDVDTKSKLIIAEINGQKVEVGAGYTFTTAQGGTVTIKADGSYIYSRPNTDEAKQWTEDSFTYKVKDERGLESEEATVNIKLNPYPTAEVEGGTGDEDTIIEGKVIGKDTGNTSESSTDVTYTLGKLPAHGKVILNSDGTYTYEPSKDYNGEDKFTVIVTDKDGATTEIEVPLTINPVDDPLEADEEQPLVTNSGTPYTSFIKVTDVDGDILSFKINLTGTQHELIKEEGAIQTVALKDDSGNPIGTLLLDTTTGVYTFTPDPTYKGDGFNGNPQDFFTVTVSDNVASEIDVRVDIWVNDKPIFTEGSEIILPAFDEDAYGEGNPLTGVVHGTDEDNKSEDLTFKVTKQPAQGEVTLVVDPATGKVTYKFIPNKDANGDYEFTITVTDKGGLSSDIVIKGTINPVDDPLYGETEQPIAIQENTEHQGKIEVIDVDGDDLTYTVKGLDPVAGKDNTFTTPKGGEVTVNPKTGEYTYTPAKDYYGDDDSFTVVVDDGHGNTLEVTVPVDINKAPTVEAEDQTTNENTPVTGKYTGEDLDGDKLTFTVSESPKHGTVVLNTDGTYTYTPDEDYTGDDSFVITVNDGKGGTSTEEVKIKVNALPEVEFVPGFDELVLEEDHANFSVKISDIIQITDDRTAPEDMLINIKNQPSNGTVYYDADTKSFVYTPNKDYFGKDNFVITVKDTDGGSVDVIIPVTVTPVNDAPVGQDDYQSAVEGHAVYGEVVATDVDSNKFTFKPADGYKVISNDGHYIVIETGKGTLKLDSTTGKYSYKPNMGQSGQDVIHIIVTDDEGAESKSGDLNITIDIDYLLTATAEAKTTEEGVAVDGTIDARQLDGKTYSYTEKTAPANGSVILNADGSYTYTPKAGFYGQDSFVVTVADKNNPSKTVDVLVNITVTAKGVDGDGGVGGGTELPGGVDPSQKLTYTKDNHVGNGTVIVDPNTGVYTYTPADDNKGDSFEIVITDESGAELGRNKITIAPIVKETIEEDSQFDGHIDFAAGQLDTSKLPKPSYGKVVFNEDGSYSYIPNENFFGKDSFSITVKNADGSITQIPVVIDVTPVNDAPDVEDEVINTTIDMPVTGQLKAVDVDGDKLTYSLNDPSKGGALQTELTTKNGGKFVLDSVTGQYTYTPPTLKADSDSITVYVNDGHGGISPITVTIDVTDRADATADLMILDEDTSILDISAYIKLNGVVTTDFTIKTPPKNGTLTEVNGKWVYQPNKDYFGKDNFIVEVSDGKGGTIKVIVPVQVDSVNDDPVGHDADITVTEDREFKGKVTATDVDSNRLTFEAGKTAPKHGSIIVKADGSYTYTPAKDYNGSDTFTITVKDEDGGSSEITVNVTVTPVNDAPEAEVIQEVKVLEEEVINFKLSDYLNVIDVDTPLDQLTYEVSAANGTVSIDKDGNVTYVGHKDFFGVDKITVIIRDGQGGVTKVDLPVNVENVNDAPTAEDIAIHVMQAGTAKGNLNVIDVDGDELTYQSEVISKNGIKVTIDQHGNYTYQADKGYKYQSDSFDVIVKDPSGASVIVHVDVTIEPKPLHDFAGKMNAFMTDDVVEDTTNPSTKAEANDDAIFNVLNELTTENAETIVDTVDLASAEQFDLAALLSEDTEESMGEFIAVNYNAETETTQVTLEQQDSTIAYQPDQLLVMTQPTADTTLDDLMKTNQVTF